MIDTFRCPKYDYQEFGSDTATEWMHGGLLSSISNKNEFVDSYVMAEDNLIKTDSQGQHARACVCMFNGSSTKVYAL